MGMIDYSDHRRVKIQFNCAWPCPTHVSNTFRDYKKMDILSYAAFIQKSKPMTYPSDDPDKAAKQFDMDLSVGFNRFVLLHT